MRSPKPKQSLSPRAFLTRLQALDAGLGRPSADLLATAQRRLERREAEEAAARLRDTCDRCLLQEAAARRLVSFEVVPFVDGRRWRSGPSLPFRP
jgi:hypothetical protein